MNIVLLASVLGMAAAATATESDIVAAAKSAKEKADKLDATEREIHDLRAKLASATTEKTTLVTERDAAVKAAKDADMSLAGAELDALIGTKIVPTEKEGLLELAAANRPLFNKQVAALKARPDMALTGEAMTARGAKAPAPTTGGAGDGGSALDSLVSSALG